jgi:hypothetical protein
VSADRRPKLLETALFNPSLTPAEKVFICVVTTIKPEFVDGARRHGSKAMGPDGKFSLHLDYLAGAVGSSPDAVRKIQKSLRRKRCLDLVHSPTFGRPATWQALVVSGEKNVGLTRGRKLPTYRLSEWLVRGAQNSPLTYREPGQGAPEPKPAGSATEHGNQAAARGCRWHGFDGCPTECADHLSSWRTA